MLLVIVLCRFLRLMLVYSSGKIVVKVCIICFRFVDIFLLLFLFWLDVVKRRFFSGSQDGVRLFVYDRVYFLVLWVIFIEDLRREEWTHVVMHKLQRRQWMNFFFWIEGCVDVHRGLFDGVWGEGVVFWCSYRYEFIQWRWDDTQRSLRFWRGFCGDMIEIGMVRYIEVGQGSQGRKL